MSNYLSKYANKPIAFQTPELSLGNLKKTISGIQKTHTNIFAVAIH